MDIFAEKQSLRIFIFLHPRPSNNFVEISNCGFSQAYLLQMYVTNDANIEQDNQPSKFSLLACMSLFLLT